MRLESIRNRSGLLMIVIGVAMLAFIMMDLMSSQRAGGGQVDLSIGEVYDEVIDAQEFENQVQQQYEQQKQNNPNIQLSAVRNSVWNLITRELVFEREYNELGISVCNEELFDLVQGPDPYPTIKQAFTNPETGEFDRTRLLQYLKEDIDNDQTGEAKAQWLRFEEALYTERLNKKYLNAISKGLNISDIHAEMMYKSASEVRNVSYVDISYRNIPDSLIEVEEHELIEYIEENSTDYQQLASRDLEYVVFTVSPSGDDDLAAFKWIDEIKEDFINAVDESTFIRRYSDLPFNVNSNSFVSKDKLGSFTRELFDSKIGTVIGPYREGKDNYRLAKLVDRQNRPDSVKARHILLVDNNSKTLADSLKNLIESGTSFSSVAKQFSKDPGSAENGGDLGWFSEGKMVPEFNDACFNSKIGEIQVIQSQFGLHLIEVTQIGKRSKKIQLAFLDRAVVASNETYQEMFTQAGKFAAETNDQVQFDETVLNQNLTKRIAEDILDNTENISGLENPREMIRWAYDSEEGDVSDVMEFGNKFVVATLTKIKSDGLKDLEEIRGPVESVIRNKKRGEMLIEQLTPSTDLNSIASDYGVEIKTAEGLMYNNINISGIGEEPAFIGAAFAINAGEVSSPFIGKSSVYVIRLDQLIPAPEGDYSGVMNQAKTELQNRVTYEVYQALEELAEIKDNRSTFY